jgi:hypothetical protein
MRRVLFSLHLPKSKRVRADYAVLVELLRGLRDGDILNVCVHSIYEGGVDSDPANWNGTSPYLGEHIRHHVVGAMRPKDERLFSVWLTNPAPCHLSRSSRLPFFGFPKSATQAELRLSRDLPDCVFFTLAKAWTTHKRPSKVCGAFASRGLGASLGVRSRETKGRE